jgi:outer membrane cobalamin receptor
MAISTKQLNLLKTLFYNFLLLLSISVSAQTGMPSITGVVKDFDGEGINGVLILVKGTNFRTETDANGSFKLSLPAGKFTLNFSRVGYKKATKEGVLAPSQNLSLSEVVLSGSQDMKQVDIAGKTQNKLIKEQAFNVNVLDAKQLYNTSADLNQALSRTSGVRVREDGGLGSSFTFSLNGFSGRQVKFFLDGIPMDNFGSSLTLNNFPVNMAERVEVYKGVTPISLGADALGGAVNIVTRSNPNYLDVSYGYGSFNTHKVSFNHAYTNAKNGFTVRTNAFYNYSDNNYKVDVKPINLISGQEGALTEVERFHDAYESATIQFEAGVTGKKYADKLMFGVIASANEKDIQTGVTMEQVFGARTSRVATVIPTLKYKKSDLFLKGLDLSLYSAYNMSQNRFIDTARVRYNWLQETQANDNQAENIRTQLKNKDNEALVTANLAYQVNQNHSLAFNYVMTDFKRKSSDVENPANITYNYPQQLNKQIMGLAWEAKYNKWTATLFSKLYLLNANSFDELTNGTGVPDYQATNTKTNNFGYGVAGAYFIITELQAKASYEHTYRLPEAIELLGDGLLTDRNSALKPENSDNLNLGAMYSFQINEVNRFGIEANYIYRRSHDYIRLDQAQVKPRDRQYINIGDVNTDGVEGEIRYSWNNKFQAKVNVTYQNIIDQQEFLSSTNLTGTSVTPNLGYGYRIPNTPYLFGNANVGYLFNNVGGDNTLNLSYDLNFVAEYFLTPEHLGRNNIDNIPKQFAHNIMANYIIGAGKYNVSLECRNFTNNNLFDNFRLQKPGRSVFLKLRYFISK